MPKYMFPLPQLCPWWLLRAGGAELGACRVLTTAWHSRFPGINSGELYTVVISQCHKMCLKGLANELAVGCCTPRGATS